VNPSAQIVAVERVLVAVTNLDRARETWAHAGFAIAPGKFSDGGLEFARMAAGAVEIDLVALTAGESVSPLLEAVAAGAVDGGGIIGWIWGIDGPADDKSRAVRRSGETAKVAIVPGHANTAEMADVMPYDVPNVFTAALEIDGGMEARRARLRDLCGANENTVDYLEHIVVMTPDLEHAIAVNSAIGVPCKRTREVGNGARQAFFKLEQTVLEFVGPARGSAGCWGVAVMCSDIGKAVAHARAGSLQTTDPKPAIQGGLIARVVDPLDGVAIAFMQPGPRRDT
jgi:hypothetical protein